MLGGWDQLRKLGTWVQGFYMQAYVTWQETVRGSRARKSAHCSKFGKVDSYHAKLKWICVYCVPSLPGTSRCCELRVIFLEFARNLQLVQALGVFVGRTPSGGHQFSRCATRFQTHPTAFKSVSGCVLRVATHFFKVFKTFPTTSMIDGDVSIKF